MNKFHQSVQKGNKCVDLELKDQVIQREFGRTAFYNAVKYFIMKLNNVTFCEIFNNSSPCYIWFFNTANREYYMMGTTYYISGIFLATLVSAVNSCISGI